jgi:hypothetical protein
VAFERTTRPDFGRRPALAQASPFRTAFEGWIDEAERRDFGVVARDTLDELAAVVSG